MNWTNCYRDYVDKDLSEKLHELGWNIYTESQYIDKYLVSESIENCAILELAGKEIKYIPDLFQALQFIYKNYPTSNIDLLKKKKQYKGIIKYRGEIKEINIDSNEYSGALLKALKILCEKIIGNDKENNIS